ncbi:MAG TPA: hypothetical protein VLA49_21585 [Anaerolineales bacterium]|nr:hypothetical protein [Anaerolineales bacterium]
MTIPGILLGLLISTLYGAAFHLWRGGGAGKLVLYLLLGWAGFWIGHIVGTLLEWSFASIGSLRFGAATLFSLAFLVIGHWLSQVEIERK